LPRESLIRKYAGPNSRFIQLPDGSAAHVEINGQSDKPVVVLLHGGPGSSVRNWDGWTPALAADYRVVAIDLPGDGVTSQTGSKDYSRPGMVAFIHAVLSAIGVHREALVGHSMGGGVAVEHAERYPGEVWALVLIDSSGSLGFSRQKRLTKMSLFWGEENTNNRNRFMSLR
jgi:pimeloyl-ACP methyl ester carboxylesterase